MSYHTPHCGGSIEVWYAAAGEQLLYDDFGNVTTNESGWYWQACFPGCMPDGEPVGPFETKAEAIEDGMGDPE
jgi:hypothetical protein